ncbi:GDSL esterase/lipase At5g45670 [Linum perenne]
MVAISCLNWAAIAQQVPGYFIFGDSLVDNGNNNRLQSLARADYMPYGIDFPGGPTGRFSNGKTTAEQLGFTNIPPYVTATGQAVLRGVNYASAAAGIREETGQQLGGRISFSGQVRNYQNTAAQIVRLLGSQAAAATHLSRCIFSIGLGSNDYLNNYFMPAFYNTARQFTPDQYADDLIRRYSQQLQILYNNGARKFVLIGVGQIGCAPAQLAMNSPDGTTCVRRVNDANAIFDNKLRGLVDRFNGNTPDAKFIYINAYGIFQDLITNPAAFGVSVFSGLRVTNRGCCGVGRNNGQITSDQTPCDNRSEYVFWDSFHPTEASNKVTAARTYKSFTPSDSDPFDIHTLAKITLGKHKDKPKSSKKT